MLYAFDLLMVRGRGVRPWPLEDRREQLHEIVSTLPEVVRYSETFNVRLADLERAVREHRLEGIVAKRARSPYRSGERSGDWLKWRANRGQEFVIGGYIPIGSVVDSLLVGYYTGRDLRYAGSVRAGLPSEFRRVLLPHFEQLQIVRCPFVNLPDRAEGRWGEGLTAAKMGACRWLHPLLVARIEFLEWTPENRLRHPRFSGIHRKIAGKFRMRSLDGLSLLEQQQSFRLQLRRPLCDLISRIAQMGQQEARKNMIRGAGRKRY